MNTVLKFWFKYKAQHVANQLNKQYSHVNDFCFAWKVERQGLRYLITKEYHGNVAGTYIEVATQRHIGA